MTDTPWNTRFTIAPLTQKYEWLGVPPGVARFRDVIYKTVRSRALRLDVFKPEAAPGPVPVIVWLSGGGFRQMGYKGTERVSAWLAGEGFAVLGVEYRVTPEGVDLLDIIADVQAAVRWVGAHAADYGLDASRIGAYGDSAGGHLATMLGVGAHLEELTRVGPHADQPSGVHAVCSIFGPCDVRPYIDTELPELLKSEGEQRKRQTALVSPIDHVSQGAPPHLLLHGDSDTVVPLEHSTRLQSAMHAAGVECTLAELPGVGHDGIVYRAEETRPLVSAFFKRHLMP